MNAVMERERAPGREPRDVSAEDRGYDVESREAGTARLRFIKVKGRRADARAVTVTRNEMLTAYNARDACILAVALVERGIAHDPNLSPEPGTGLRPRAGLRRGLADDLGGGDPAGGGRSCMTRAEAICSAPSSGPTLWLRGSTALEENMMAGWDKEAVERTIREKGWYESEREIQHGHQFILVDGTSVNCYNTGRVLVQGKDTDIKQEAEGIFSGKSAVSGRRPRSQDAVDAVPASPERVFIVYGHDHDAREQLEHRLRKLKIDPIILQNIPGGGDTIIEKLEQLTGADFACVLFTPDDEGREWTQDGSEQLRRRVRQNVVLELGMVLSRLGRSRVAILVKGNKNEIEPPSDIDGLIYIPFSNHVDDAKNELASNLQNAGFNIRVEDLSK